MAKAAKTAKKRAKKYDNKLAINGSFDDVMKVFAGGAGKPKETPKKAGKNAGKTNPKKDQ